MMIFFLGILAGSPAYSQAQTGAFGDWVFGIDTDLTAASTEAAGGARFGIVCSLNCLVYVDSGLRCRDGAFYMGTVASTLPGFEIQWQCRHLEGRSVLTAPASEQLVTIIAQCEEITFSVALEDENLNVLRFSLGGAYEAVTMALEAAIPIGERLRAARGGPAG